jgi:YVTN family beta-propeller protein
MDIRHTKYNIVFLILFMMGISTTRGLAEPYAFITNSNDNSLSIIDVEMIETNPEEGVVTLPGIIEDNDTQKVFLSRPWAITIDMTGRLACITNTNSNKLLIIDTRESFSSETFEDIDIIEELEVGETPVGVAFDSTGSRIYVVNNKSDTLTVVDGDFFRVITEISLKDGTVVTLATTSVSDESQNNTPDKRLSDVYEQTEMKQNKAEEIAPQSVVTHPFKPFIYVANSLKNSVTIIKNKKNRDIFKIVKKIKVGGSPYGLELNPSGSRLYVTLFNVNKVAVINTFTRRIIKRINVGDAPIGVAVHPTGEKVYVSNSLSNTVSVIDAFSNGVIDTIDVGSFPQGISLTTSGDKALVANSNNNNVSIINLLTGEIKNVGVGVFPVSLGSFITPEPDIVRKLNFLNPDTKIFIGSGSLFSIKWEAPLYMTRFKLFYSLNRGYTWKLIDNNILTTNFDWKVPVVINNKKKSFFKVKGFDLLKTPVHKSTISQSTAFIVGTVQITRPDKYEVIKSGASFKITWETFKTQRAVKKVKLFQKSGRNSWKKIALISGNPGIYQWIVPQPDSVKSQWSLKVVLKGDKGETVGRALSEPFFIGP